MNLIFVPQNTSNNLLEFAINNNVFGRLFIESIFKYFAIKKDFNSGNKTICAIPEKWKCDTLTSQLKDKVVFYGQKIQLSQILNNISEEKEYENQWFTITNGRYLTKIDSGLLDKLLKNISADVITVNIKSELSSEYERIRLTSEGNIAGFKRLYFDAAELSPIPDEWPNYIFSYH